MSVNAKSGDITPKAKADEKVLMMNDEKMSKQEACKKCFLPAHFPKAQIGADGTCSYCKDLSSQQRQEKLRTTFTLNREGELKTIAEQIKAHAVKKKSKYDCIIGASKCAITLSAPPPKHRLRDKEAPNAH